MEVAGNTVYFNDKFGLSGELAHFPFAVLSNNKQVTLKYVICAPTKGIHSLSALRHKIKRDFNGRLGLN